MAKRHSRQAGNFYALKPGHRSPEQQAMRDEAAVAARLVRRALDAQKLRRDQFAAIRGALVLKRRHPLRNLHKHEVLEKYLGARNEAGKILARVKGKGKW